MESNQDIKRECGALACIVWLSFIKNLEAWHSLQLYIENQCLDVDRLEVQTHHLKLSRISLMFIYLFIFKKKHISRGRWNNIVTEE